MPMRAVERPLPSRLLSVTRASGRGRTAALVALVALLGLAGEGAGRVHDSKQAVGTSRPLVTGFVDPWVFSGRNAPLALTRAHAAGARVIRLFLYWRQVAPATKTASFKPSNPADPHYTWGAVDRFVKLAHMHGLEPLVDVLGAPTWAQKSTVEQGHGDNDPSPAALAQFARAAGTRYGGDFKGLPRVRFWQVWNEPNLDIYLKPQVSQGRVVSVNWYRSMVNAFAGAIHGVHRDNLVVAGGLSPFERKEGALAIAPMVFMRDLLCMSGEANPKPTCTTKIAFDVWAHHPYTVGGPTHTAANPDDISLGDMPKMKRLLDAAASSGHIVSSQRPKFWVTEFSWDSDPPDPQAVPMAVLGRWTAEALYQMWRNGVSLVTWFLLRDDPTPNSYYQSGLYTAGANVRADRPKLSLTAFRFPFVAYSRPDGIFYWGRTPSSAAASVAIEQQAGGTWTRVTVVKSNRNGIFTGTAKTGATGLFRARMLGRSGASLPFSLDAPPDHVYSPNPFGGPVP
jgi:hypothetical protein